MRAFNRRPAMVEFIGPRQRKLPDDIKLVVERTLHGKIWRFVLHVPQTL
jgi:hypothetical protein